ncbi:chemotaxis protein CheB [Celeribacter marinus]|uniref:chemotaxis protein CheB n=1 Tax=Celeribacter marinus TaxID=1397108 RepID=UPI003F6B98CA
MTVVPIVGIGASAGGLEALQVMISSTPIDTGAAYVIVQHFAPTQKSVLHELLQTETELPVAQIKNNQTVEPNHIYIVPPGNVADIDGDTLHLTARDHTETQHRPIDSFFKALARERGRDAFCVILSGTGSDGTKGLREVKAVGGVAFVQDRKGARFAGMPDSAIETGLVDFILTAAQIPVRIDDVIKRRAHVPSKEGSSRLQAEIHSALPRFSERLEQAAGHDFGDYKPGTLVRRIERRMAVLRLKDVDDFLAVLEDDDEAKLLAQDFLIGVTHFFRDPEAFEALRVLAVQPILQHDEKTIRVWVPGCSSGEEVYSLAMLFIEEMESVGDRRPLQVFGTDIDTPALMAARYGLYSQRSVDSLTEERRNTFFQPENGQYRVIPRLRECCVFAPHNLLQDPPFSRLDLISCRNLMIYLSASLQKQVIPRFHFALRGRGNLFLGPSETLVGEEKLFETLDKNWRIFCKNTDMRASYSSIDETPRQHKPPQPYQTLPPNRVSQSVESSRESTVERTYLRHFASPFALVSKTGEILYLSQNMTGFVQPSGGAPSTMIDSYLMRELRFPVRTALAQAVDTGDSARIENVILLDDQRRRIFDIEVAPSGTDFILIMTQVRAMDGVDLKDMMSERDTESRNILEAENVQLRRQLAMTLQQFDTSGQELKSGNEELMSMNEELQSTNEELETSREELEAINEELETVNAELKENNRLLTRANSDLKNLFESTDLAVLFIDRAFCVRNFTPATSDIFGIKSRDIGRPIDDLSSRIDYPDLKSDAQQVDDTLQVLEREFYIEDVQKTYMLRMKPYRTTDNRIDGYVLSFIDITQRKAYENSLKENERAIARQYAELEQLYDTIPVGLSLMDRELRWVRINSSLAEMNGFSVEEHIGRTFRDLLPDIEDFTIPIYEKVFETGEPVLGVNIDGKTPAAPGEHRHFIADFYPVWQEGQVFAVGSCVREVTEQTKMVTRVRAQNSQQQLLMGELQHRVKNTLSVISSISQLLLVGVDDPAVYHARLQDRLSAISRTHDLLTDANWTTTALSNIVANEAKPFETNSHARVKLSGPDIQLTAEQALSVGMALHELVTNAAKYGALSRPKGFVEVVTRIHKKDGVAYAHLTWTEHNGPKITKAPKHTGFGSLVLERVLKTDLAADVTCDYRKDGLFFELDFELAKIEDDSALIPTDDV